MTGIHRRLHAGLSLSCKYALKEVSAAGWGGVGGGRKPEEDPHSSKQLSSKTTSTECVLRGSCSSRLGVSVLESEVADQVSPASMCWSASVFALKCPVCLSVGHEAASAC